MIEMLMEAKRGLYFWKIMTKKIRERKDKEDNQQTNLTDPKRMQTEVKFVFYISWKTIGRFLNLFFREKYYYFTSASFFTSGHI